MSQASSLMKNTTNYIKGSTSFLVIPSPSDAVKLEDFLPTTFLET